MTYRIILLIVQCHIALFLQSFPVIAYRRHVDAARSLNDDFVTAEKDQSQGLLQQSGSSTAQTLIQDPDAHTMFYDTSEPIGTLAELDVAITMMDTVTKVGSASTGLLQVLTMVNAVSVGSAASLVGMPLAVLGGVVSVWGAYKEAQEAEMCLVENIVESLSDLMSEIEIARLQYQANTRKTTPTGVSRSLESIAQAKSSIISGFCVDLQEGTPPWFLSSLEGTKFLITTAVKKGTPVERKSFDCKEPVTSALATLWNGGSAAWKKDILSAPDEKTKLQYMDSAFGELLTLGNTLAEPLMDFKNTSNKDWQMDSASKQNMKKLALFNAVLGLMTSGTNVVNSAETAKDVINLFKSQNRKEAQNAFGAWGEVQGARNVLQEGAEMDVIATTFAQLGIDISTEDGKDKLEERVAQVLQVINVRGSGDSETLKRRIETLWLERRLAKMVLEGASLEGTFRGKLVNEIEHIGTIHPTLSQKLSSVSLSRPTGQEASRFHLDFLCTAVPHLEPIRQIRAKCKDKGNACATPELGSFRPSHQSIVILDMNILKFDSQPCTPDAELEYPFTHDKIEFKDVFEMCHALSTFMAAGFHIDVAKSNPTSLGIYIENFQGSWQCRKDM